MDNSMGFITQFKEFDTSKQVFTLLDETSENFREKLDDAIAIRTESEKTSKESKARIQDKRESDLQWESLNGDIRFGDPKDQINKHIKDGKSYDKKNAAKALKTLSPQQPLPDTGKEVETQNAEGNKKSSIEILNKEAPKSSSPTPLHPLNVDAKESAKVLASLQSISKLTQVSAPNYEKMSDKLLSIVKGSSGKPGKANEFFKVAQEASSSINEASSKKESVQNKTKLMSSARDYMEKIQKMKTQAMEQIRFQMKLAVQRGVGEVSIHLKPEYLGQVKIHMLLEASSASTRFLVENQAIKELVLENTESLKESLSDRDIELGELEVFVSEDQEKNSEGGRSFNSFEDRELLNEWLHSFYRYDAAATSARVDEEDSSEEAIIVETDELLNIVA